MLNIVLRGCNGRMGSAVSELCLSRRDVSVVAGIDIDRQERFGYPVYADPLDFPGTADVAVDFSTPRKLDEMLDFCIRRDTPLVLATTGLSESLQNYVRVTAQRVAVFQSSNFSLGVSLLTELAAKAAKVLGEGYDIEIVERHHNAKRDAPSGTALTLLEAVSSALPYEPLPVYGRHGPDCPRSPRDIGIHALRGGSVVGQHDIIFAGRRETLTISHAAASREVFAEGALKAAAFIARKAPGLYAMKDLLRGETNA
ncbi:MAG: 4-hydroxy-tetrahydrodipicolinate reductase [Oscillospiraceae bacterium]|jgi:4-hydroxy-tetrahydrodipicolinate reductase|nr:4-hydroxy-tetrahydrodipicolinate reductase [Oscillospiraceae bacterium]